MAGTVGARTRIGESNAAAISGFMVPCLSAGLYADGGYAGPQFQAGPTRVMRQVEVEIVKRSDAVKGFAVLPKRWIVGPIQSDTAFHKMFCEMHP